MKALEYYFGACTITDAKQKRAVLLHVAGRDVQDVFETLANTGNDYDTAKTKLNDYLNQSVILHMRDTCFTVQCRCLRNLSAVMSHG